MKEDDQVIEDLLPIIRAKKANSLLLRARPNVVGLDVGFRTRRGEVTQERVVKVYVSRKIDASFLSEEQRIPSTVSIDGREVGVDIEQRAIPRPAIHFTLRDRPLRGGMSISTSATFGDLGNVGTGTLGICVTLNDGNAYILSNNHVLAATNQAQLGTPILQPSVGDGGVEPDDIVALLSSFVPLDFGSITIQGPLGPISIPNSNFVDAALAQIIDLGFTAPQQVADGYNVGNRELHWIGYPRHLVSSRWTDEQKALLSNVRVCKMGRTSEFTMGTIISAFNDVLVGPYNDNNGNDQYLWFEDQIIILGDPGRPFFQPGDSGSLLVAFETGQPQTLSFPPVFRGTDPIGLLFASSPTGQFGYANPLDAVLDELGIPQL
ncbi:MAG: hypothetical protein ACXW06_06685 [Halobacteriota archaeon]